MNNQEKKEIKKCVCGEQDILGGADVEIGGVCHRGDNPCYVISQEKKEIEEKIGKEIDFLADHLIEPDQKPYRFGGWREEGIASIMSIMDSYANKKLDEVREKVEKLKYSKEVTMREKYAIPHQCNEYQAAVEDILSILSNK